MRGLIVCALLIVTLVPVASAEVPHVVTDIAPVQSLVAAVMKGAGEPAVLIGAGTSPHNTSLRPSAARALSQADVLIWIGPELTPWLGEARLSLAPAAVNLPLMTVAGTELLPVRDEPVFDPEGAEHEHDHEHDHDGAVWDPHVWLDPQNARIWVDKIAEVLSQSDPDRAALYQRNAAEIGVRLEALTQQLSAELAPLRGTRYLVYHDAFQYFAARFDLPAAAAIQARDAQTPGAARVATLRAALAEHPVACAITEPQLAPRLIAAVVGTGTPVIELDPLGRDLPPGPDHYAGTLRAMATALTHCTRN